MDKGTATYYKFIYAFCLIILISGLILGDYRTIVNGMLSIFNNKSILITDYFYIAGVSATFFNVSAVTFVSALLLKLNNVPLTGRSIFALSLMSGFSFFGKNIFSMWFIFLGTYILSVATKEKFSNYVVYGLLATSLSPMIEVVYIGDGITFFSVFNGLLLGIVIGFLFPLIAEHTNGLLKGLTLYNGGFAIGIIAALLTPILQAFNLSFESPLSWTTGNNLKFSLFLYFISFILIFKGYLGDKKNSIVNYKKILNHSGVITMDFIEIYGIYAVLINMGVNIFLCTTFLLAIGGDFNGPTIGAIFVVMGFSSNGKHFKNMFPITLGIYIGSALNPIVTPLDPVIQITYFLGTNLAPIAGTYGFIPGVFTGIIHSFAILRLGSVYGNANLYNNGFIGGLVTILVFPFFNKFVKVKSYGSSFRNKFKNENF